jgi:hypothetical protein
MSGFGMEGVCLRPTIGLQITMSTPTYGDCFNPPIPTDRLSTLNWTVEGTISVYAANMELINDYGVGERMLVPNPDHLRFGKCLLVCTSETAKYYCLHNNSTDVYYDGEVIQLGANEERTISGCNGHFMFCSLGNVEGASANVDEITGMISVGTANSLGKYDLATIDSDSYVVTAGAEGAIITVFYDSTND